MSNVSKSACTNSTSDGGPSTFWIDLFTRDIITCLGIIGNILILVVLVQKCMRNTFNKLQVSLALSDTIMLITCLAAPVLKNFGAGILGEAYTFLLWPLRNFAMTTSVFLTVSIALERLLAVSDPLNYASNRRYGCRKYVSSAAIIAALLSIHLFFEIEPTLCNGMPGLFLGSVQTTAVSGGLIFTIYNTVILKLLVTGLIPILMLISLYAAIYFKIKEHRSSTAQQHGNKMREEQKLAGIFAGVVLTSLITITPDIVVKIITLAQRMGLTMALGDNREALFKVRDSILNSAINIFIYTFLGKEFRKCLWSITRCSQIRFTHDCQ